MDYAQKALKLHEELKGKLEIKSRISLKNKEDLALAYTPGVAEPCLKIKEDINKSYQYYKRLMEIKIDRG